MGGRSIRGQVECAGEIDRSAAVQKVKHRLQLAPVAGRCDRVTLGADLVTEEEEVKCRRALRSRGLCRRSLDVGDCGCGCDGESNEQGPVHSQSLAGPCQIKSVGTVKK